MDAFFLVAIKQKIRNWYSTEVTPLLVVWPYFSELLHIEALDLKKKIWCNQKHFFLNLILNFQKAFWRIPILKNCDSSQTLSCWLKDQPVIFFLSRQKWASTKEWEHQEYICLFSFRPRFLLLKVTYFFVLQATKANSALTVSCSPVFALSLFTVKVPAAISFCPLANDAHAAAPSMVEGQGGGRDSLALLLRPRACSASALLAFDTFDSKDRQLRPCMYITVIGVSMCIICIHVHVRDLCVLCCKHLCYWYPVQLHHLPSRKLPKKHLFRPLCDRRLWNRVLSYASFPL